MTAPRASEAARVVAVDPSDARKTASVFFAEMPWDGLSSPDPAEWPAARFFDLMCRGPQGADAP